MLLHTECDECLASLVASITNLFASKEVGPTESQAQARQCVDLQRRDAIMRNECVMVRRGKLVMHLYTNRPIYVVFI